MLNRYWLGLDSRKTGKPLFILAFRIHTIRDGTDDLLAKMERLITGIAAHSAGKRQAASVACQLP